MATIGPGFGKIRELAAGHQPTLDYVQRRTAQGRSKPEINRCLKRYVAREIFGDSAVRKGQRFPPSAPLDQYSSINALAESINGLYKTEAIRRRGPWRSLEAVEFATLEWVDWFNSRRLLEPIGNIPPAEAEECYYEPIETLAMAT